MNSKSVKVAPKYFFKNARTSVRQGGFADLFKGKNGKENVRRVSSYDAGFVMCLSLSNST